jgi:hypothetical protein
MMRQTGDVWFASLAQVAEHAAAQLLGVVS